MSKTACIASSTCNASSFVLQDGIQTLTSMRRYLLGQPATAELLLLKQVTVFGEETSVLRRRFTVKGKLQLFGVSVKACPAIFT